jgi:hypothetical protein
MKQVTIYWIATDVDGQGPPTESKKEKTREGAGQALTIYNLYSCSTPRGVDMPNNHEMTEGTG